MEKTKIEIPISKTKFIFIILGCFLFIGLCVFIILNANEIQTRKFGTLWIIGFACIGLLFFGGIGISVIHKMFDKKAGIIIDEKGIWDNSSGVSVGLIEWDDILGIRKVSVSGTSFLLIDVSNPEKYINRLSGVIKKIAVKANKKNYGTPISISANGLKTKLDILENQIIKAFEEYK